MIFYVLSVCSKSNIIPLCHRDGHWFDQRVQPNLLTVPQKAAGASLTLKRVSSFDRVSDASSFVNFRRKKIHTAAFQLETRETSQDKKKTGQTATETL